MAGCPLMSTRVIDLPSGLRDPMNVPAGMHPALSTTLMPFWINELTFEANVTEARPALTVTPVIGAAGGEFWWAELSECSMNDAGVGLAWLASCIVNRK